MRGAQRPRPCSDREAESDRSERTGMCYAGPCTRQQQPSDLPLASVKSGRRRPSRAQSAKPEMMRSLRSTRLVTKPPHLTGRRPPSHDAAEAPRPPEKWLAGHHCRSVHVLEDRHTRHWTFRSKKCASDKNRPLAQPVGNVLDRVLAFDSTGESFSLGRVATAKCSQIP